ncbi:MAG TPA: sulfate ABC transporter permease subunit CysT [Ardenticatenaceae bacterium]|nr:sulfate ABC transporter permease subunit CysT [Ardenticatenaceae bacterium]
MVSDGMRSLAEDARSLQDSGRLAKRRVASRQHTYPWGAWSLRALAVGYLGIMLIVPLAAVIVDGFSDGLGALWRDISRPAAWSALRLTLWTAALMTVINSVMGTLTAYVLVRYRFPGRSIVNAVIDLPFAIPSLVTGVMLVVLYGPQGALGGWLKQEWGWDIIFAPPGIILALLFISFPFVVRSLQPVLMTIDLDQEEAAYTLGASPWTTFRRVLLPAILPATTTGALLAFARALGEFGSVVIVAGNIPMRSQTAAVYVLGQIESENQQGASAMSVVMLSIAFVLIVLVDWLQRRQLAMRETP